MRSRVQIHGIQDTDYPEKATYEFKVHYPTKTTTNLLTESELIAGWDYF